MNYLIAGAVTDKKDPRRGRIYFLTDANDWNENIIHAMVWREHQKQQPETLVHARPGNNVFMVIEHPIVLSLSDAQLKALCGH